MNINKSTIKNYDLIKILYTVLWLTLIVVGVIGMVLLVTDTTTLDINSQDVSINQSLLAIKMGGSDLK